METGEKEMIAYGDGRIAITKNHQILCVILTECLLLEFIGNKAQLATRL